LKRRNGTGELSNARKGGGAETAESGQLASAHPIDASLVEVIETMSDGVALFDADENLRLFNSRYKDEIWPRLADILRHGVSFTTIATAAIERGLYGGSESDSDELLKHALTIHRYPPSDYDFELPDGSWIRQRKQATKSGGILAIYTNITESKRREAALKQSEARLLDAQRVGRIGDWERDLRTRNSRYSVETYRMCGIDPDLDLTYEMFIDAVHPDDREKVVAITGKALDTGEPSEGSFRVVLPDGSINVLQARVEVSFDEKGEPLTVFGVVQDITERAGIENSLRESEERYRLLIETSPIAMVVINPESGVVFANSAAVHLYGADSADQLIGHYIRDLVHPDDRERVLKFRQEILQGNRSPVSEYSEPRFDGRRLRLDGAEFWSDSRGVLVDWDGQPSVLLIIRDISERKRAEEEKERQRLFLETLVANIPARVSIKDREGRYTFVSVGSTDDTDPTREYLIGKTSEEAFGRRGRDLLETPTRLVFETGEPVFGVERIGLDPPGRIYVSNFVPIKGNDGEVESVLTVSVDITKLKQAEGQLHQAQKMEAVGQLTGGVAHEFNNLLMVIVGNLELTLKRIPDEATRKFAQLAMNSAIRGGELTRQLLAFSRKQDLVAGPVRLNELVTGMGDMLQLTLGETVVIDNALSDDIWPVLADAGQVESALLNLALNARDAMPKGGTISIRTANASPGRRLLAEFPDATQGDFVMLEIVDTGDGMTREILERVFEPFFSTKDVGQGTGLGLSMVRGFVEQSGGCVEIDSEPGKGTRVRIYLPRTEDRPATSAPGTDAPAPRPKSRATVLVVEDDPGVRELVVLLLSEMACDVVETGDGGQALALLRQRRDIDVLFTDVVLPGRVGGPEIAEAAQRLHPGIRVAFTSGYPDGEIRSKTGHGRQPVFIRKPYRKAELAAMIASVLEC
jgi:PAS domain S-box-containing protein